MVLRSQPIRILAAAWCLALLAIAAGCCCASKAYFYQPAGLALVAPPESISTVDMPAPKTVPPLQVSVLGRGTIDPDTDGTTIDVFSMHFAVANVGSEPMTLDPSQSYLIDDVGTSIAAGKAHSGPRVINPVTVAPGSSAEFHLSFALPTQTPLKDLRKVHVRWPYTYGGRAFIGGALFAKVESAPADLVETYGGSTDPKSAAVSWSDGGEARKWGVHFLCLQKE
jgi:hypothetical protein